METDLTGNASLEPVPSAQLTPLEIGRARSKASRVLLIVNGDATRVSPRARAEVLGALAGDHLVDVVAPDSGGEATELSREAAAGSHHLVIAFGGDGTASAVARGLLGTGIPLGFIPGGLTNVVARTLGVPRDPIEAAAHIADLSRRGATRSVALGTVDGLPYLFAAGAGFSAALMERLAAARDGGFGTAYAVRQATALAFRAMAGDAPRLRIDAGGREADAIGAIVQNSDPLTFLGSRPIRICTGTALGPPEFGIAALRSARVRDVARLARGALSGRVERVEAHPRMEHFPALREARITSLDEDGLPVEADGDFLGRRHSIELGVADSELVVLA
jgi:diacylglycerol kinase family enzyme